MVLNVGIVVGYMLKILKCGINISNKHQKEFSSVRHGDFVAFQEKIGENIPPFVLYNAGIITVPTTMDEIKNECMFVKITASGPSLKKFYDDCLKEYGDSIDEFPETLYYKLALFELSIRNYTELQGFTSRDLVDSINALSTIFSENEINKIHDGRHFLNNIKGHKRKNGWENNRLLFEEAYELLLTQNVIIA